MGQLSADAVRTLIGVAEALEAACDDWWLIGGAAASLHGLDIEIADVDVLLSRRDLQALLVRLGIGRKGDGTSERFRSDIWAQWTELPLCVDLMAGLQVRTGESWTRIEPETCEIVTVGGRSLYLPSRIELIGICRLFGRAKDLARVDALAALC